jgi:hypothetical protein
MIKLITCLFLGILATTCACNNVTQSNKKAVEVGHQDNTANTIIDIPSSPSVQLLKEKPEEVRVDDHDSIDFERYYVDAAKVTQYAPVDWTSYPETKDFKTRILEAYQTNEISFAGYYVVSIFGCGAGCIMGFMIDVRDGKIYDLPLGEENSCLFAEDRAMGNLKSRLFIAGVCRENPEDQKVYYKAYLWGEDKKEFQTAQGNAFFKKT